MPKVEWSERLSVGIDLIDEQHKVLIKRLDDFAEAVHNHHGPREITRTLGFLMDYTDVHFSTEERHMTAGAYPGLDAHRTKHEEFKGALARLGEDFEEEGATQGLAESINTLLINWLVAHIQSVDVQFGVFLKEKGIRLDAEG